MAKRPPTVQEIKNKKSPKVEKIKVYNCSKQMIPIHMKQPKGVDFYMGAQDVFIPPGGSHDFPADRLISGQLDRLAKRNMIQISKGVE